jgi:phosphoglycolate phosphatase-like HAD superfamily hydrolase
VVKVAEEKAGVGPLADEAAALARDAVDAARRALEVAARWRRKYLTLKRRSRLVLDKVRDAVAELESAGGNDPRVRAALELLYDLERMLAVVGE